MIVQSILEMLVTTEESRSRTEAIAALEKLLNVYGFQYYGVHRLTRQSESDHILFLASHWPEGWPEVYHAARHGAVDPVLRYFGVAQRPFRWKTALKAYQADPHRKRMEKMMAEAETFGLEDGYLFPIHGRGGSLGFLTIGGRPIDLSPTEIALFNAGAKSIYWKLRMLDEGDMTGQPLVQAGLDITKRELEVLHHLADGLTSIEISRILNISRHTVDWYVNGIQTKLNARNRQHAVAIGLRDGMIH